MTLPSFDDLPFNARPDLTPYLIHLTKTANERMAARRTRTSSIFCKRAKFGGANRKQE
jgi:hypothetical protein